MGGLFAYDDAGPSSGLAAYAVTSSNDFTI
jgi:hypothetical protein